jgi:hypothetical protein
MTPFARTLVYITFLYTCVEGLVINVLFPARLPYLFKDVVIVALYVAVLLPNLERVLSPSPTSTRLNWPLGVFMTLVVFYLVIPSPSNLLSQLVAVKQRLFYIPLIFIAYTFLRNRDDLRRLAFIAVVASIPVSLFGIYLYFTGPEGLQRLGGTYAAVFYTPTGASGVTFWRVPGTFTSPGQYGAYLVFNVLLAIGLIMVPDVSRRQRFVIGVAIALLFLAMLTSGSRSSLVVASGSVALALVMSGRLTRTAVWGLAIYVVIAYGFVAFGPGVRDRFGSIASYEHVERFQQTYFGQLFLPTLRANPLGLGLGTATIGARHFSEFNQIMLMESYLGILAAEMGVVGLLAFVFVPVQILLLVLRNRRFMSAAEDATLWMMLAAFVIQVCLVLPVSTVLDSAPSNFYFWFVLGVVIRMIDIEHWRLWYASRQADESEESGETAVAAEPS